MSDILFDVVTVPAADAFYDSLSDEDQRELETLVTRLRLDPHPDETAGKVPCGPGGSTDLIAYSDPGWVILYRIVGQTIELWTVLRARPGGYRLSGL